MARSTATINQAMLADIAADTTLSASFTSTSTTAIWRLFVYIYAMAINLFEQALDLYQANADKTVSGTAVGSLANIQYRVFNFQYDVSTNPLTNIAIVNPDWSVGYPIVNSTFRIITRCAVIPDINKNITVKVAKAEPPIAMSGAEITVLDGYLSAILPAGVTHTIVSQASDKISIVADIYFDGQYFQTILATITANLNNYLRLLPFNGVVTVAALEDVIMKTTGVKDCEIKQVYCREDTTVFANATLIYNAQTGIYTNARVWNTIAGYIVQDAVPNDFATTLTLIPQ